LRPTRADRIICSGCGRKSLVKNICDEAVVLSFVNLFARPCDGEKKQKE